MFNWYRNAARCYVYLPDVSSPVNLADGEEDEKRDENDVPQWKSDFEKSRWFTRGWTLQELLAPRSVEFFSSDGTLLGDKVLLMQEIQKVTGIPFSALQGALLSDFTVNERISWNEPRTTKLPVDRVYSLMGILGISMSPIDGESVAEAHSRLTDEIDKQNKCIQELYLTDPCHDKARIEGTKGGLLKASYSWILNNASFQHWRNNSQSQLLWIKGDPGKGKTMLLWGIIDELKSSTTNLLSFFFCQGTDSRINSATAVLRGLIFLLTSQQPSLISHMQRRYDQVGSSLFQDKNAWVALSEIFTSMMQDSNLKMSYLVVDALDECMTDLPRLLDLIVRTIGSSARVKWLVSSRNEAHIEQKLKSVNDDSKLSLELKQNAEQVACAVDVYIDDKLLRPESLEDDSLMRDQVRDILRQKANGTFLWVALMIQELESPESWDPLAVVEEALPGLYQLYDRMMGKIQQLAKRNAKICRLLLSTAAVAYHPLYLAEMGSLRGLAGGTTFRPDTLRKIIAMCGSFLTIRNEQVYLVHQSAKDYLSDKMGVADLPAQSEVHYDLFTQSLKLMSSTLKRDMFNLVELGFWIGAVKIPDHNDPLAASRYSCLYWIDHIHDSILTSSTSRVGNCVTGALSTCS